MKTHCQRISIPKEMPAIADSIMPPVTRKMECIAESIEEHGFWWYYAQLYSTIYELVKS